MEDNATPNGKAVIGKVTIIIESSILSSRELELETTELLKSLICSDHHNVFIVPADEYPYE